MQVPKRAAGIMGYELSDCDCAFIKPILSGKPRGNNRRVLYGI
jgi:hypothetical protein